MQATVTQYLDCMRTFLQVALDKDLTHLTQVELLRAYACITDMIETWSPLLLEYPEGQECLDLMKANQADIEGYSKARRQ